MRTLISALALAGSLLAAAPLYALHTGGSPVIIPVAGRFPGAGGTQWRTDLFVANPFSITQTATIKFYQTGGAVSQTTVTLTRQTTASYPDVVLNTFGLTNAAGTIEVSVAPGFTIEARATIYNTGNPAGQFGQGLPGIALGNLSRQAYLFGLSGINGTRLNVGASNPNETAVQVQITLTDSANQPILSRTETIAAHGYVQINDIFATLGVTPRAGVTVNVTSESLIYGYSSEVRNDTGDAIFSFGISPNS
ncbi:MAG TPA: hypothetical protein VF787_13275 [Thermoanaerobaculia bacterium]